MGNTPKPIFSENLDRLMKEQGLTQVELAERVGVSQNAVHRWVNGSVPRGDKLNQLAQVLEISGSELLTGETPMDYLLKCAKPLPRPPTMREEESAVLGKRIAKLSDKKWHAIKGLLDAWEV